MRQVPVSYLVIGNGRLARHLCHYFSLLNIPVQQWHRGQSLSELQAKVAQASHILVLISDDALQGFISEHLQDTKALIIHCSGSQVCIGAYGVHPLMTFGQALYDLAAYQQMPLLIDHDAPEISELLPGLSNPHQRLHTSKKAQYHALCVLAGNFSCMLWQKLFSDFEGKLNLPKELAHPYLKQQMQNLLTAPEAALTGPVARQDHKTIAKNLEALSADPFQEVYESFVRCYQKTQTLKASL